MLISIVIYCRLLPFLFLMEYLDMSALDEILKPCENEIALEHQETMKAYLNTFFGDIHNIRLRMQMHLEIANAVAAHTLNNQYFWGFFQGNVNVSLIVVGMFSIFEDGRDRTLKTFVRFLRARNIYFITDEDVSKWLACLKVYEGYRNCFIAHSSLTKPYVPPINYQIFIEILDELEIKLGKVKGLIKDPRAFNGVWSVPIVDLESLVLLDLRKLLSYKVN